MVEPSLNRIDERCGRLGITKLPGNLLDCLECAEVVPNLKEKELLELDGKNPPDPMLADGWAAKPLTCKIHNFLLREASLEIPSLTDSSISVSTKLLELGRVLPLPFIPEINLKDQVKIWEVLVKPNE
ncbi:hypothetical protein F2Q69_00051987 [Brassica cretica]|uniref:Uncharacterized protein n=1 Tax=Brassica cretica TaxID=69181 RepID=A0A8S9N8Y3_BRACR|nr:hypothetical protein F2Q69_00051987 [Brassica cretica]